MIHKLFLENFRGILKSEVDLGKINVFTGANNSGKSSIIYGLLTLKNLVLNPNQSLDSFLNLGFLNLGGFSQTVYQKEDSKDILIGIETEIQDISVKYKAKLGKKKSSLGIALGNPFFIDITLDVTFPYPVNMTTNGVIKTENENVNITWNGIALLQMNAVHDVPFDDFSDGIKGKAIDFYFNSPIEELRTLDFIPLRRGFTKPYYSSVPMQQQLFTEDELATLIATDRDLEGKVAFYLEKIVGRIFNVRTTLGTANFNLQSRDRETGLVCDLVNEGFGTNQLVTILARALRKDMKTICIEESEIHLHPELMDRFIQVLIEITKNENKHFIITTHSEHIVSSLLNAVAGKKLKSDDLRIYYMYKKGKESVIENQLINEKGQVEGGLKSFYETELKEIKNFLQIDQE